MYIYLFICLWLHFCSLSGSLAGGLDWVLLMTCLNDASRELWAGAAPPLDCWDVDMARQHYLLLHGATREEGTLISGMNKHGRRHVSGAPICKNGIKSAPT